VRIQVTASGYVSASRWPRPVGRSLVGL